VLVSRQKEIRTNANVCIRVGKCGSDGCSVRVDAGSVESADARVFFSALPSCADCKAVSGPGYGVGEGVFGNNGMEVEMLGSRI
jgi:hypothetical protein